jgi:hypothetical protein
MRVGSGDSPRASQRHLGSLPWEHALPAHEALLPGRGPCKALPCGVLLWEALPCGGDCDSLAVHMSTSCQQHPSPHAQHSVLPRRDTVCFVQTLDSIVSSLGFRVSSAAACTLRCNFNFFIARSHHAFSEATTPPPGIARRPNAGYGYTSSPPTAVAGTGALREVNSRACSASLRATNSASC